MHARIFTRMQDASSFKRLMFKTFLPIGERRAKTLLNGGRVGLSLRLLCGLGDLFLFRKIRKHLGLSRVHNCLSGAAALSPDIHRFFHAIGVEVVQGYGLTEVAGITNVQRLGGVRLGTCGLPVNGVKTKLAEDGEILIKCQGIFQGYYRDKEATQKIIMENGWLRTGDIGTVTEEGHLAITDRKKDIIITSGGENIAPTEIENRIKVSPYIKEAIAVGDGRKYLCCLIQIDHENVADWAQRRHVTFTTFKSLAENALVHELIDQEIQKANEEFASVWQIKKFHLLTKELDHDDDELTATQKVRREQISRQYYEQIESMYGN
jgi:long-chain acyl-CoA synthetase